MWATKRAEYEKGFFAVTSFNRFTNLTTCYDIDVMRFIEWPRIAIFVELP